MKRVVIPVGEHELTRSVVRNLTPLLRCEGAEAVLLRVHPPGERDAEVERRSPELDELYQALRGEGIDACVDWIAGEDVAASIVEHTRDLGAGLVALATQGRPDRRLLGDSVAVRVLRHASSPLLLFNPWSTSSLISRLLVPLDGSELAGRILPLVERVAQVFGAEVVLLRVLAPTDSETLEAARASLEAARAELQLAGLAAQARATRGSDVAEAILQAIQQEDCDGIAMTTHGQSARGGWAFGSVAENVFRHATVPLLVKRVVELSWPLQPPAPTPLPARFPRRILVPLDGSEGSNALLAGLPQLVAGQSAELELLRVLPEGERDRLEEARAWLSTQAEHCEAAGLPARGRAVVGDPAERILAAAARTDLVLLATRGRRGLTRWVRGSVAERVLRRCPAPLLLYNPGALAESLAQRGVRRIAVALDGSPRAARILPLVAAFARAHDAQVVLVRAEEPPLQTRESERLALRAQLAESLEAPRAELAAEQVDVELQPLLGPVVESLLGAAGAADLLALTTHGRRGLSRWLLGSVAEQVLRHCARPLLVLRVGRDETD